MTTESASHVPVLLDECLELLDPRPGQQFIDATVGSGGHAAAILERTAPGGRLLGLDADAEALPIARARLAEFGDRVELVHSSFRHLERVSAEHGFVGVDGLIMDLGLSSVQLARGERGFSFSRQGPLDMRFDRASGETAAELIASAPTEEIEQVLRSFGEEPAARRIAARIAQARTEQAIDTTQRLVDVVASTVGGRRGRLHPATRVFQALRIAVNEELTALKEALPQALALLRPRGRLAIISFHSLEDRIVKTFLRERAGLLPPPGQRALPILQPPPPTRELRLLNKRPLGPSAEELERNPRSRSARLRAAERV